jgi:glyoxylase I family protein
MVLRIDRTHTHRDMSDGSDDRNSAASRAAFPHRTGMTNPMDTFPPLTHTALTVRDLSVSVPWYRALFDADPVIDEDTDPDMHHTVFMLGNDTLVGLHQHRTPAPAGRFSEFGIGLDHVAFACADRAELEKWASRLDELGIQHGAIKDASYGSGLSFRDPDGIALEFFAPPA